MSKGKKKNKRAPPPPAQPAASAPAPEAASAMPAQPTADQLPKIIAEEKAKCQAKEEFETNTWFKCALWWVQRPIVMLLISGVALSCLSSHLQKQEIRQREEQQRREHRRKIAIELTYRIDKAETANAVDAREFVDGNQGALVYPEFKDRPCASLLVELASLLPPDEREQLNRLAREWGKLPPGDKVKKDAIDTILDGIRGIVQRVLDGHGDAGK